MFASLAHNLENSGLTCNSAYPVSQEGKEVLYATVTENDILSMLPET